MVICEKYNFIFLRVPKNASTSLASWFVTNCCDPSDTYTKVGDASITGNNVPSDVIHKYTKHQHFIHMTLQELYDNNLIGNVDLAEKEVITVIRNPFERQLSLFFFLNRGKIHTEKELIEKFRADFKNGYHFDDVSNKILQIDYSTVDGKSYGEPWLYEDIDNRLSGFIRQHDIPYPTKLAHYKKQMTPALRDMLISKYYDNETTEAVLKYYEKDFLRWKQLAFDRYGI